jgi:hypothetical protein
MLNFGRVTAGSGRILPVTVTLDARLLEQTSKLRLVSSSPHVTLALQNGQKRTTMQGRLAIIQVYDIKLSSQAPVGRLSGALYFGADSVGDANQWKQSVESNATHSQEKSISADHGQSPSAAGLSLPFVAEIIGGFSATPGSVFFGVVPSSQEVHKQVVLSGASIEILKSVRIASDSPWITISAGEAELAGNKGTIAMKTLKVSLNPKTPAGVLETRIIVTATTGDKLILPIVGHVEKSH